MLILNGQGGSKAYIDNGDAGTLASAKAYADSGDSKTLQAAKEFVGSIAIPGGDPNAYILKDFSNATGEALNRLNNYIPSSERGASTANLIGGTLRRPNLFISSFYGRSWESGVQQPYWNGFKFFLVQAESASYTYHKIKCNFSHGIQFQETSIEISIAFNNSHQPLLYMPYVSGPYIPRVLIYKDGTDSLNRTGYWVVVYIPELASVRNHVCAWVDYITTSRASNYGGVDADSCFISELKPYIGDGVTFPGTATLTASSRAMWRDKAAFYFTYSSTNGLVVDESRCVGISSIVRISDDTYDIRTSSARMNGGYITLLHCSAVYGTSGANKLVVRELLGMSTTWTRIKFINLDGSALVLPAGSAVQVFGGVNI